MDTSIKNLSDAEKYSAAIKSGTKAVPSMLILICHSSQDGDEFDFGSYKVRAAKVAELFAHPRTHFLPNSCFSESLIQAAGMERRWKSIYSHTIALASTDATVVTRACLSALVKPGGVDRNIAVAAKEQLMHEGHKFVKTCSHQKCSCAKTGKAWFACHPVSEASKARTRAFDFPSSEDDTDDTFQRKCQPGGDDRLRVGFWAWGWAGEWSSASAPVMTYGVRNEFAEVDPSRGRGGRRARGGLALGRFVWAVGGPTTRLGGGQG
eukprot:6819058-Prymnesium_polylepis.1